MDLDGEGSFERLWTEERPRVVRTAFLITGNREDALDLAQEAFVLASRKWKRVAQLEHPGAWLQRTVAYLALNKRRRDRSRTWRERRFAQGLDALVEPELPDPALAGALADLTPAQRAVVVVRFYADQSVEDTARALHKRPGTVRALTSQALGRLRAALDERGEVDLDA
jgi:RNA polymerase sigma factor (sigma-70 family)